MRTSFLRVTGLVIAAACVIGFGGDAAAQGFYLGGAYSWATASIEDVDADLIDDSANAYKLFLGYDFNRFAGLEAGYVSFGTYDVGSVHEEGSTSELSSTGWTAALTGGIPLGELFTLYTKVGYFWWDAEIKAAEGISDLSDSGNDLFYGAGLRVNIGKFAILGEYERFEAEDLKNDLVSLGFRLTF